MLLRLQLARTTLEYYMSVIPLMAFKTYADQGFRATRAHFSRDPRDHHPIE